ncbi:MAG TPA: MFS transporter, partial [Thermoanaerobaculia bacterium]|nr:MFS transporter [Thermoanaerobaculia bacterium]
SAFTGAIVNALLSIGVHGAALAIPLRFVTGVCLAGVYPPGMKIVATWFRARRGVALGTLVAALTVGKASPYLINAIGSSSWRTNLLMISVLAVIGGAIVLALHNGPYATATQPFDIRQVTNVFGNRGVRLANFGYFGHRWELYAVWTWAPVMLRASFGSGALAETGSFLVIGSGAAGCVIAGLLADRYSRATIAGAAMAISGTCCIIVGFFFGHAPALLLLIMAIWVATVVADSAQFSAAVTEFADARYLGTALTMQTCVGFLITTISIRAMPVLVDAVGWRYAFIALAPGPFLGIIAMARLRHLTATAIPTTSSAPARTQDSSASARRSAANR